ncbi:solute carrier family 25 member 36-A-like [Corticium candelabrum]|uniref:solute carrier family 25 member 36-A-like n=1 Tax=Corticium candelabrum TaxID=121492 RepID=UPI002E268C11|nr:solute carrier family 25 member 36-A-like [Corticium candelabrum]
MTAAVSGSGTLQHLIAGGIGGTVAAAATSPLEVVKTRLQSSVIAFQPTATPVLVTNCNAGALQASTVAMRPGNTFQCMRHIFQTEGPRSLFKGLTPTLMGVAPARAIYFAAYSKAKQKFNSVLKADSPLVHLCSAACAGVTQATITNPIWMVRTRLQLDAARMEKFKFSAVQCVKDIYTTEGVRGFYRGLSASYAGVSETALYFIIYEHLKSEMRKSSYSDISQHSFQVKDLFMFMGAAACSKLTATALAYPHEVIRTRLRQNEGVHRRYHTFFQSLLRVWQEEGVRGLYGGLGTHLIRVIPNSAIMFATYEMIVRLWSP